MERWCGYVHAAFGDSSILRRVGRGDFRGGGERKRQVSAKAVQVGLVSCQGSDTEVDLPRRFEEVFGRTGPG